MAPSGFAKNRERKEPRGEGHVAGTRYRRALRLLAIGLIIGLGAYWADRATGPRLPSKVQALPQPIATIPAAYKLDPTEAENVRIYKAASPAVANIVTRAVEYDFFYNAVPVEGAGSGFLIDTAGHILTNYHVVQGAQTIEVTLGDQTRYKAKFIGADTRNDIALIQIDPNRAKNSRRCTLGDSRNLQVGQRVLAIGNPFGFQSTLTTGIVSSLGRTVQTSDNDFHRRGDSDRRGDQPRKFGRPAAQFARRGDRHQQRDLFAQRKRGGNRLRDSHQYGAARGGRTDHAGRVPARHVGRRRPRAVAGAGARAESSVDAGNADRARHAGRPRGPRREFTAATARVSRACRNCASAATCCIAVDGKASHEPG